MGVTDIRLYLNHIPDYDWLIALEFGRIDDGQPNENWRVVSEHVWASCSIGPTAREVGFKVTSLSSSTRTPATSTRSGTALDSTCRSSA